MVRRVKLDLNGLRCSMDKGIPHFRAAAPEGRGSDRSRLSSPPGHSAQLATGETRPVAGGFITADARFANGDEFQIDYGRYNKRDEYEFRSAIARLTISPEMVLAQYPIDSPSGIPVGWRHDLFFSNPIGRVQSMQVEGSEIFGRIAISRAELETVMPGGEADLRAGMNAGLSIGFFALDPPEVIEGEGTLEDPDQMTYGRIAIYEVSATPLPRLPLAGILAIFDGEEKGDTEATPATRE